MFKLPIALAAVFAGLQVNGHYQNGTYSAPTAPSSGPSGYLTGTQPSFPVPTSPRLGTGSSTADAVAASSASSGGFSSSSYGTAPISTYSSPIGSSTAAAVAASSSGGFSNSSNGTAPTSIYSSPTGSSTADAVAASSASGGFSSSSYGTAPITTYSSLTTEIVYTTTTTVPDTETLGSGQSTTVITTTKVSTIVVTSTKTLCTKCTAAPGTSVPASNVPAQSGATPPYPTKSSGPTEATSSHAGSTPTGTDINSPTGGDESVVVTYTQGTGSLASIITTTIYNTHQVTKYDTVRVTPTAGSQSPSESGSSEVSPEKGSPKADSTVTVNDYITATSGAEGAAQTDKCPQKVTVTVPGPEVTVTVTGTSGNPSDLPGGSGGSIAPYPTGSYNGTNPTSGPGTASSGFITKPSPSASFTLHPSASK